MALVPPAALVVFADSVLDDVIRPVYGIVFLLAAMSVLFADSLRRVQGWGPVWSGPRRRDRLLPAAGRGARRVALGAVAVAVLAPMIVPGFGSKVVDLGGLNSGGVRVSTLVSIAGQLTRGEDRPVFDVYGDVESYWRMTSLDYFDGIRWQPTEETPVPVQAGADVEPPLPGSQTVTDTFEVTNDLLFQWLPGPFQPTSIALDGDVSWLPGSQTAVMDGNLEPGDTYQVTSSYVEPTPDQLRQVAWPTNPDPRYVQTPPNLPERIYSLADSWTAGATSMYDAVYDIQDHLRDFHYSKDVSLREDTDTIVEFLEVDKKGFCQQFATAMAVLLRAHGIPARVAVGFTTGTPLPGGGGWHVTTNDLHAWVEVPFAGYGWLAFEPTPDRTNPTAQSYAGLTVNDPQKPVCPPQNRNCGDEGGPTSSPPPPPPSGPTHKYTTPGDLGAQGRLD
jgi:transglutaminase-like putative cysteine protease